MVRADSCFRRYNDIDLATKSKSALEHRQREEARIRREANEKWETKVTPGKGTVAERVRL